MKASVIKALGICLLAAGLAGALGPGGAGGTSARAVGIGSSGQDPRVLSQAFGIRFLPQTVAAGQGAPLPSGVTGIGAGQALAAAMAFTPAGVDDAGHSLLPDVTVTAEFGSFTDDHYGRRLASGALQPTYTNRPAWIVTFSGAGVRFPLHGPRTTRQFHHEMSVVVDASSGEVLLGYSYR